MSNNNCAFQYATGNGLIIKDTALITREEAEDLKTEYIEDFKRRMAADEDPEMAIWINMSNEADYRETAFHIQAGYGDLVLEDGVLVQITKERIG